MKWDIFSVFSFPVLLFLSSFFFCHFVLMLSSSSSSWQCLTSFGLCISQIQYMNIFSRTHVKNIFSKNISQQLFNCKLQQTVKLDFSVPIFNHFLVQLYICTCINNKNYAPNVWLCIIRKYIIDFRLFTILIIYKSHI